MFRPPRWSSSDLVTEYKKIIETLPLVPTILYTQQVSQFVISKWDLIGNNLLLLYSVTRPDDDHLGGRNM
jgi:hypothetical protein